MLLLFVAGIFAVVAPTWILCACGLGDFEDEVALQWVVWVMGLGAVGIPGYVMFFRQ
jgi:hypothetical protein